MGARVRIDASGFSMEVVGHGTLWVERVVFGTLEGTGPAYLYSLRQAFMKLRQNEPFDPSDRIELYLSHGPEKDLDRLDGTPVSPSLALVGERLLVRVAVWPEIEPDLAAIRRLLEPFLARHRASCVSVSAEDETDPFTVEGDSPFVEVLVDWPTKGRTVAEAWKFGEEMDALLRAGVGGEVTQATALDLLRGDKWELLLGQPESAWLEAKGEPYDHLGKHWQYELAKDVAAFANSPEGGLIVIGMTTDDRGDGDTIRGFKEFELRRVRRQAYRNHVAQRVYPRVAGFDVERLEGSKKGNGLAVLVIPPQPKASQPFLVQGTLAGGAVLGAHVLLPVRREDDTAFMDAGDLHARIRLGEQVIAGKKSSRPA
jgi:hypothetical protein